MIRVKNNKLEYIPANQIMVSLYKDSNQFR